MTFNEAAVWRAFYRLVLPWVFVVVAFGWEEWVPNGLSLVCFVWIVVSADLPGLLRGEW